MGQFPSKRATDNMFKVAIASALVAVSFAAGPPAYGAPPPAVYKEEKLPPQPFAYEYGVNDDYSKANFKKTETQDANGVVAGSYVIALPDGRIQTTKYTADNVNGFVAEVSYEGTPVYPPEPAEGYGHAAPVAAYAPAPPVYKPSAQANSANIQTLRNQITPPSLPYPRT